MTAYQAGRLFSPEQLHELGLFRDVRPMYLHVSCTDPALKVFKMKPTLHNCIRCRQPLKAQDVVQPVMGVHNPRAVNPDDPTDIGVALGDRIYFIHADCANPALSSEIVLGAR